MQKENPLIPLKNQDEQEEHFMKIYLFLLNIGFGLLAYSAIVTASPASTEYVNSKIKEAVDTILIQVAKETQKTESKINTIPVVTLHEIGESYQGGIIFWVDETRQHGLIVAKIDANQSVGMSWQNGESGDKTTNALGNGVYAGLSNTHLIVSQQTIDDQEGRFAALSAQSFSVLSDGVSACTEKELCYGNWYLPSLNELHLLRANLYDKGLGNLSSHFYWSSTEASVNQSFALDWSTGESVSMNKASTEPQVRAVHSF
jgi:hypothetical protein